jgi:hypothetical protein
MESSRAAPQLLQAPSISVDDTLVSMSDIGDVFMESQPLNNRSTTPLSQLSQDSCHTNETAFEKGQLDVIVKQRVEMKRTNSAIEAGMPEYKMSANPRGCALIIEMEEYDQDVQTKRVGSHVSCFMIVY